jgi:hypothetical protein
MMRMKNKQLKSVSDVDGNPLTAVGPMIANIFSSIAVNLGASSCPPPVAL